MITQKAALVGCKEGPWISTSQLRGLKLRVVGAPGVKICTTLRLGKDDEVEMFTSGPGVHQLADALWAKVKIMEGSSSLCFFISG